MKKILLLTITLLSLTSFGQENFQWEKIDTTNKTKSQLYSDTKLFITETWKSAKDVIQNDDREGGVITIKGVTSVTNRNMGFITDYYSYMINFFVKDGKYRIVINNVRFSSTTASSGHPSDPQEEYPGLSKAECSKKVWEKTNKELKNHIQGIMNEYITYIQKTNNINSSW